MALERQSREIRRSRKRKSRNREIVKARACPSAFPVCWPIADPGSAFAFWPASVRPAQVRRSWLQPAAARSQGEAGKGRRRGETELPDFSIFPRAFPIFRFSPRPPRFSDFPAFFPRAFPIFPPCNLPVTQNSAKRFRKRHLMAGWTPQWGDTLSREMGYPPQPLAGCFSTSVPAKHRTKTSVPADNEITQTPRGEPSRLGGRQFGVRSYAIRKRHSSLLYRLDGLPGRRVGIDRASHGWQRQLHLGL